MAYTVAQLITHAEAGDPIQITNVSPQGEGAIDVNIEIGGRTITTAPQQSTKTVNDSIKTPVLTDFRVFDLGTWFTAKDVLESVSLKVAVEDGLVEADAGTVALSKTPTV